MPAGQTEQSPIVALNTLPSGQLHTFVAQVAGRLRGSGQLKLLLPPEREQTVSWPIAARLEGRTPEKLLLLSTRN